jgi:hypothetical protein
MNKYLVQYLTAKANGSLDDRETVVEAASAAEAKAKVESATRHAYYAELAA